MPTHLDYERQAQEIDEYLEKKEKMAIIKKRRNLHDIQKELIKKG